MIISKTVKVKLGSKNYKHFQELGYELPMRKTSESTYRIHGKRYTVDFGKEIEVAVDDLMPSCNALVDVACDYCSQIRHIRYADYTEYIKDFGIYACADCGNKKAQQVLLSKYGYTNPFNSQEIQNRIRKTNLKKYGVENPFQSEEVKEKIKETNLKKYGKIYPAQIQEIRQKQIATMLNRYGTDNPMKSPMIQEKAKRTNLQRYGYEYATQNAEIIEKRTNTILERYGVKSTSQSKEVRKKIALSVYNNGSTQFNVSKQQVYICNLYNGLLNYPIQEFNVDVLLPNNHIVIEYDGSGHKLSIAYGTMTENQFIRREIYRSNVIKQFGYKIIRIISRTDKLPSDSKLLEILDFSRQYFKDYPNHSWIEWHIDDGLYRNAEHKDGVPYDFGELRRIRKEDIA